MSHEIEEKEPNIPSNSIIIAIRGVLHQSKWILVIFYVGLIIAQGMYAVKFVIELWHMMGHFLEFTENEMMLAILGLIDVTMIANLVKTIVSGSYHSFVDKDGPMSEHISSGYLKVKMGMSLVGVSSIHLLQSFINSTHESDRDLIVKCGIHMIFLFSTIGLAIIEYLHEKSKSLTKEH